MGTIPMTKTISSMSHDSMHKEEKWDEMEDEVIDFSVPVLEFADGTSMKVRTPVDQKSEEDSDGSDTDKAARKARTIGMDEHPHDETITPADRFPDDYDRSYPSQPRGAERGASAGTGDQRRGEERGEWDRDQDREYNREGVFAHSHPYSQSRGGYHHSTGPAHERGSGYNRSHRINDRWKGSSFEEHRGRGRGDGGPGRYTSGRYERRNSFEREGAGAGEPRPEGGHFERRGSFEYSHRREGSGGFVGAGDLRERSQEGWGNAGGGGGPGGAPGPYERRGSWDRREGNEFHPTLLQRPRRMSNVSSRSDRSSERGALSPSEQGPMASSPPVPGSRPFSILQHERDRDRDHTHKPPVPFHPPRRVVVEPTMPTTAVPSEDLDSAADAMAIDRPAEVTAAQKEVMLTAAEKAKKRREEEEAAYLATQARAKAKAEEMARRKAEMEGEVKEKGEEGAKTDEAEAAEKEKDTTDERLESLRFERPRDVIKQNISEGEKIAAMAGWAALPAILEREERERKEKSKRDKDTRSHFKEHKDDDWSVDEDVERHRRLERTSSSSTSASGSNAPSWQQRSRKFNGNNGNHDNKLLPPGQEHERTAPRGRTPSPSPRPTDTHERSPRPVKIAQIDNVMSKIRESLGSQGTSIAEIKSMGASTSTQSRKDENGSAAEVTAERESSNAKTSTAQPQTHSRPSTDASGKTENHVEVSGWDTKSDERATTTGNNWNSVVNAGKEEEQHQSIPSDAWGVSDTTEKATVPIVNFKRPSMSAASGVTAAAAGPPRDSPVAVVTDPQNESRAMDTELFDGRGVSQAQAVKLPTRRVSQDIQGGVTGLAASAEPGRNDGGYDDSAYYGGGFSRGNMPLRGRDRASERSRGGPINRGGMGSRGGGFTGRGTPMGPGGRSGPTEQLAQFGERGRGPGRGRVRGRGMFSNGFGEPRDPVAPVEEMEGVESSAGEPRPTSKERAKPSRADTARSWRREEPVNAGSEEMGEKVESLARASNIDRSASGARTVTGEEVQFNSIDLPPAAGTSGILGAHAEEDDEVKKTIGKKKKKGKGAANVAGGVASPSPTPEVTATPKPDNKGTADARASSTGQSAARGRRGESGREIEAARKASVAGESVGAKAVDKVAKTETQEVKVAAQGKKEVASSKLPDDEASTPSATAMDQPAKATPSTPKIRNSPIQMARLVRKKSALDSATESIFPEGFDAIVNRKPTGMRFTVESEIPSEEVVTAMVSSNADEIEICQVSDERNPVVVRHIYYLISRTSFTFWSKNYCYLLKESSEQTDGLGSETLLISTWSASTTALPVVMGQKSSAVPQQQQIKAVWKTTGLDGSSHAPTEDSLRDFKADQDSAAEMLSGISDLRSETSSVVENVVSASNAVEKSSAPSAPSIATPGGVPSVPQRHSLVPAGPGPRPGMIPSHPRLMPNQNMPYFVYPPGIPGNSIGRDGDGQCHGFTIAPFQPASLGFTAAAAYALLDATTSAVPPATIHAVSTKWSTHGTHAGDALAATTAACLSATSHAYSTTTATAHGWSASSQARSLPADPPDVAAFENATQFPAPTQQG
ncbi:hypothetical protein BC936DRAFT_138735 [Jimgerdemannia flammicorona]|uniref:Uncharacterized protein n=1 Tax=Jimgerdemannia flammicorona TaxID=994334 RepID=A0A433BML2_9FUNG|nr:hypothetical protein BC936DRAFT_138735 [Jimgerdemannia flammicorona]